MRGITNKGTVDNAIYPSGNIADRSKPYEDANQNPSQLAATVRKKESPSWSRGSTK